MLQVADRGIDPVQRVTIRYQLVQLKLSFAVPTNEDGKVAVRLAVSAARARERTIADEQARIENRFCVRRRNAD